MQIQWVEDQPSISRVREQIEQSGLIEDLVAIVEKHSLQKAETTKWIKDPTGRHLYICSVGAPSSLNYYLVFIKRSDLPTNDAIGHVYK